MKKILFLYCGGTIAMRRNKNGVLLPATKNINLINIIPSLNNIAKISQKKIINIDSSNFHPDLWLKLCRVLENNYQEHDGFVVIHGSDTMAYTASYLSFAIRNPTKPVVFTGAQKPFSDLASDAQNNLTNAALVATMDLPEICIVFGPKILRANRATKISESSLDAFDSPMYPPIGEIALEPKIYQKYKINRRSKTDFIPLYNSHILVLDIFPGMNIDFLSKILNYGYKGIIIKAFGPGNIPDSFIPFIKRAKKLEVPVVILSQCQKGITKMQLYKVGHQAREFGAIPGGDMTLEAAVTKFMWLLGRYSDLDEIKHRLAEEIAGEISISN